MPGRVLSAWHLGPDTHTNVSDFAAPSADALIGRRPAIRENGVSLIGSLALVNLNAVPARHAVS